MTEKFEEENVNCYNMFKKMYNGDNLCKICKKNFDDIPGNHYQEKDVNGKLTGNWICVNCYQKYNPNSQRNKTKLTRDCRNKRLDPNSAQGLGYITCALVKKNLGVEDCFDVTGNFNYHGYDLIDSKEYGLIDAKGAIPYKNNNHTTLHFFNTRKNKKANYFICVGYDESRENVIDVYIIPNNKEIQSLTGLGIPTNGNSKYAKFKVSKEELNKWNEVYHSLDLENCPVLKSNKTKDY